MGNEVAVHLTVRLLGTPDARIAGAPLVLHHQKARAILYYLAATGRFHVRDHLATLLWSESPESNARHSLRSSLYHIRQALQEHGRADALVVEGDVAGFRRLLAEGGTSRREEKAEAALREAVRLYRGPLLQSFTLSNAPLF